MADYNIYLHTIGAANGNASPTTPWSQQEQASATTPWGQSQGGSGLQAAQKAINYASNPDSIVGGAVQSVLNVIPWVALAKAVVRMTDQVITTCLDFSSMETGDYGRKITYEDTKAVLHSLFTPVSSYIGIRKQQKQWEIENKRKSQERALLGDSVINAYTNRGV